ncbi:diguanylate cyclase [Chitinimonas naiadis]
MNVTQEDDDFDWLPESPSGHAMSTARPWKILIVDDDEQIHTVTRLNLRAVTFRGRPLQLISATTSAMACKLLRTEQDIALALIDVVMENEQSGLELARYVRETLQNREIRLVLRTGQPGQAPEQDVIVQFEVDGYKDKTELTASKLFSCVITALRTYEYVTALNSLNAELEARVAIRTAELERLAMIDPLTGAGNRRHLEARADAECANAQRNQTPLALITFDIDHFKQINDTWGHTAGDEVLCEVVNLTRVYLRPHDFLARVGGEEFVILLPGADLPAATLVAERLQAGIAAMQVGTNHGAIRLTASFGVTLHCGEARLIEVLERADTALYQAKHNGRNQVVSIADHALS